jgi:UDP-N-acetylmuramoyl-tripeptide--D-alanyl-D-alanine ligase
MMRLKALEIAVICRGRVRRGRAENRVGEICTDSRALKAGQCFLALKGARFDGHSFLQKVVQKGASGLIVEDRPGLHLPGTVPVIAVPDTLAALGDLAADWRRRFDVPLVAVTGSTGKSTTKEMIAHILSSRYRVLKNEGNLNNLIGLPLSLLRLRPSHQAAVLEMGMNRPGEIARLTAIARPEVGLITNVGPVHLEGLGDVEGVARAKGELVRGLGKDAWVVVNLDDPRVRRIMRRHPGPKVGFSRRPEGGRDWQESLHLTSFHPFEKGKRRGVEFSVQRRSRGQAVGPAVRFHLTTLGWHNVENALAAAAAARPLQLSLAEAARRLESFSGLKGRNQLLELPGPVRLVDDSYNANPVSTPAALQSFNYWRGRNRGIVVLGDMLELGKFTRPAHLKVGASLGPMGMDLVIFRGEQAGAMALAARKAGVSAKRIRVAESNEEVVSWLAKELKAGDWVLVKGSHGVRLEEVVAGLRKERG